MKRIQVGIQDFKTVRDHQFYYVDKSRLISDLISRDMCGTFLFTRPRRFGKSLNLSMIDAFLNIEYADVSDHWFDGLAVKDDPRYAEFRGMYPVLYLDLKDIDVGNEANLHIALDWKISMLYSKHSYLLDSNKLRDMDKRMFDKFSSADYPPFEEAFAVLKLVEMICRYYGRKVVILIDEYDDALNNAYGTPVAEYARRLMRAILGPILKGCEYVQAAVLTGVAQISQESLFSGLNNITVDNILSERNGEMFGFTEDEVLKICSDFGHPEKMEEARKWYDGYRFGNASVYNPWSVLKYVSLDFKADSYWAMTSSNPILGILIGSSDDDALEDLAVLESGGTIRSKLDVSVSYRELKSGRSIYSLMAMSGYLNAIPDGDEYILSVPNYEVRTIFASKIMDLVGMPSEEAPFLRYALKGDADGLKKVLSTTMDHVLSIRNDWSPYTYQAVVTMLICHPDSSFDVSSDREAGDGFCDVMAVNPDPAGPHLVVEVKSTKDDSVDLDELAAEGLKQIHERRYTTGLKGIVLLYAVAFCGKRFSIVCDTVSNE